MKFSTTVYCQTTVFVLLIILYLFGECAADSPLSISSQPYKTDIDLLDDLVSRTKKIITWKNLVRRVGDDEQDQVPRQENDTNVIKYVFERINDKLFDLQCTYAYFANNHVNFIHSIIDKNLLTEETFEAVRSIKKVYSQTAIKTKDTFINFGYQPPDWLRDFINFLSKVLITPTFHEELYRIMDILKKVLSTNLCNGDLISEKLTKFSRNSPSLILEGDSHIFVNWMALDKELSYFLNFHLWCSINTDKLLPEKIHWSKSEQWKPISMLTSGISKHYMYEYFRETSGYVKHNLVLGVNFILHGNRSTLSFRETPLDPYMMYKKRKIERIVGVGSQYKMPTINYEGNKFYYDELSKIDPRLTRNLTLLNIRIWGYPVNRQLVEAVLQTPEQYDMQYYRDRFGLLNNFTNQIMDTLNCVYVFHAHIHVTEILALYNLMIVSPDERAKYISSNLDLAFKYFDITLKTIATFYNENYVPAGWMMLLILYLEKLKHFYDDEKKFVTDTEETIKYLKRSCDNCYQQSKIMNLPLQGIQEKYDHESFQPYMLLQRELTAIYFHDPRRHKNVTIIYENLMQITYFLDMNSTVLLYSNYKNFQPSNWFFDSIELAEDKFYNFQWDTLPKKQINSNLQNATKEFLNFIKSNNKQNETNESQRIGNSTLLYNKILYFIAAAALRLVVSFLIQCTEIITSDLFNSNNIYGDYVQTHCTGIAEPITTIFKMSRLNEQTSFFTTLSIELHNYEYIVRRRSVEQKIDTKGYKHLIEICIVHLQAISIDGLVGVNIPFEWISVEEKNLTKEAKGDNAWEWLKMLQNRVNELLDIYNTKIKSTFGDLLKRSLFVNSLDVLWPHAIYDDEYRYINNIPDPENGNLNIYNYIHYEIPTVEEEAEAVPITIG